MTDLRLTYFDIDGGRAEPIRIVMHAAGVDFDDHRISFEEFHRMREEQPFACVPVLEIDGQPVTQSNALLRYFGSKAGLYPTDPLQALYCDEAMGIAEDITHAIARTIGLQGEALSQARMELAQGRLPAHLKQLERMLERGGGRYLVDDRLSIADLKVFILSRWLSGGALEHIPTDLVATAAPKLAEHRDRIQADPIVVAWYEGRRAA